MLRKWLLFAYSVNSCVFIGSGVFAFVEMSLAFNMHAYGFMAKANFFFHLGAVPSLVFLTSAIIGAALFNILFPRA